MRNPTLVLLILMTALWAGTGVAFFHTPPSPYEPLGNDSVTPPLVKPGERFTVIRNYRLTRSEAVYITRAMLRGDCVTECEIIDLPSGPLELAKGEYHNIARTMVLPANVTPGRWELIYTVQWQDRFSRTSSMKLPPLMLDVLP